MTVFNVFQVFKKRVDASVQVAPLRAVTEAQTICTYPSNMATQYSYQVEDTKEIFEQCKPHIEEYATENYENISDFLRVNRTFFKFVIEQWR